MTTKKMPKDKKAKQTRDKVTYSPEFRAEVVARCSVRDRSIAEVAKELGVPPATAYKWVSDAATTSRADALSASERQELETLRREFKRVSKDCDILRAAVSHFAKRSTS
jgi:transposase